MHNKQETDFTLPGTILNNLPARTSAHLPNVSATTLIKCMTTWTAAQVKLSAKLQTVNVSILVIFLSTVPKTSNVPVNIRTSITIPIKRLVLNVHAKDLPSVGLALVDSSMDSIRLCMISRKPRKRKERPLG